MPVFAGLVCVHALVQLALAGSAVLGVTLSRPVAVTVLAVSLVLSVLFATRFVERSEESGRDRSFLAWVLRAVAGAGVVWAGWLWVRVWELAWLRPPYDWDGLYYHIPAIHEWTVLGRIAWLEGFAAVPFVNYPMAVEAHTFLMHQVHGSSRLVDACNLWFWPLAFFSVVALAGRLGVRDGWRWLAGALLAGAPVLVCQSLTVYIDPGFSACLMAAVTSSVLLAFREGRTGPWMTLLWGMSLGLVLGAKGTGLPMAAVLVAAVLVAGMWRDGLPGWRVWLVRLAVTLAVALAVGGYWYGRNTIRTGNPIHPIQLKIGEKLLAPGYDFKQFNEANVPDFLRDRPGWLRAPVSWTQPDAPIHGAVPAGGMGYIWIGAGLPAVILLAAGLPWTRRGRHRAVLAFCLCLLVVMFLVQPANWWARFTLWAHVLALPCIALVLHRLFAGGGVLRRLFALLLAVAVLGVAAWESERTLALEREYGLVSAGEGGEGEYKSSLQRYFGRLEEREGFDRFLEADTVARSRWGRHGTLLGGVLSLPLGQRRIHQLPDRPTEDDLRRIRKAGVRWVIWDSSAAGELPDILTREAERQYSHLEFRLVLLAAEIASPDDGV